MAAKEPLNIVIHIYQYDDRNMSGIKNLAHKLICKQSKNQKIAREKCSGRHKKNHTY